jgi:hypothetical protein
MSIYYNQDLYNSSDGINTINRNLVDINRQLNYYKQYHPQTYKQYIDYIYENSYHKLLEELQHHKNNLIYNNSQRILVTHFNAHEDYMDIGEVPTINSGNNMDI